MREHVGDDEGATSIDLFTFNDGDVRQNISEWRFGSSGGHHDWHQDGALLRVGRAVQTKDENAKNDGSGLQSRAQTSLGQHGANFQFKGSPPNAPRWWV